MINIRKAEFKDLIAINEIYNQAVDSKSTADICHISSENRILWFNQHEPDKYPIFVAENDNSVVGWLSVSPYRPGRMALKHTAEIRYYIHKDFHKQGIGTLLLNYAVSKAPEYNFRNYLTIILEHNSGSIRLMEKTGFEKWGFLPEVADFDGELCGHLYYGLKISGG